MSAKVELIFSGEAQDVKEAMCLDLKNKNLIHIGCFCGTQDAAIATIKQKYTGSAQAEYISNVKACFNKHLNKGE